VTVPILAMYLELLFVLLIAVAALVVFSRGGVLPVFLPVMIPAAGAFGLYALLHAESRFLGAFAVVLFLCASASFVFPSTRHRAVMVVLALVAALNAFMLGYETLFLVRQASGSAEGTAADGNQFGVASILHSSGIPAGAKVASIGFSYNAYWARLAGVQIAMEIPDAASYWASSDSVKAIVHKRFAESGAVAIVANRFLPAAPPSGWKRLGDSRYYLLPLAAARGHAASRNPR